MPSETTIKGELACLKFEQRAIEKGAIVSRPNIECAYDRIVDHNGKIQRVQVKYADSKPSNASGSVQAHIGKAGQKHGSHKPYEDEDIDVIAIYVPKVDQVCWIDKKEWSGKSMLQLRYEKPKNNQKKGVRLVEDFVW
jgi:hypothetical protein